MGAARWLAVCCNCDLSVIHLDCDIALRLLGRHIAADHPDANENLDIRLSRRPDADPAGAVGLSGPPVRQVPMFTANSSPSAA